MSDQTFGGYTLDQWRQLAEDPDDMWMFFDAQAEAVLTDYEALVARAEKAEAELRRVVEAELWRIIESLESVEADDE